MRHVGIFRKRLKNNPREKAFADLWEKECQPDMCINYGFGQLQDLFILLDKFGHIRRFIFKINNRDATIVATMVQWLGSNCGMGFLHKALGECGYRIVKKPLLDTTKPGKE